MGYHVNFKRQGQHLFLISGALKSKLVNSCVREYFPFENKDPKLQVPGARTCNVLPATPLTSQTPTNTI